MAERQTAADRKAAEAERTAEQDTVTDRAEDRDTRAEADDQPAPDYVPAAQDQDLPFLLPDQQADLDRQRARETRRRERDDAELDGPAAKPAE
jgi:hypothetical protein